MSRHMHCRIMCIVAPCVLLSCMSSDCEQSFPGIIMPIVYYTDVGVVHVLYYEK